MERRSAASKDFYQTHDQSLINQQSNINFNHESRHITYTGTLHYPLDPSGTRVSIDDRGSSVEVFLILLDNCCKSMPLPLRVIPGLSVCSDCYRTANQTRR